MEPPHLLPQEPRWLTSRALCEGRSVEEARSPPGPAQPSLQTPRRLLTTGASRLQQGRLSLDVRTPGVGRGLLLPLQTPRTQPALQLRSRLPASSEQ